MTVLLHPERYSTTTKVRKLGVVVHDSESGDSSSANLVNALKSPGDRPSVGHPGFYGAGYHAVTDGAGSYVRLADGTAAPYAAPPVNDSWWHVCMPGFANQTRDEWLDALSRNHIKGVAQFIHDVWIEDGQTWSPLFVWADQLALGVHGYTSHYQVSLAWRKSTHTDPGPNFPFDVLEGDVLALTNPSQQEDDEMSNVRFVRHNGYINVFMLGAGPAISVAGEVMASYPGAPQVFIPDNKPFLKSLCFQSGLDMTDPKQLIPGGPDNRF